MKLYLDYVGDGIWALSQSPDFPYPRVEVCASPCRLLQDFSAKGHEIIMSDMAKALCFHDLKDLGWSKQYFRAQKYLERLGHPEAAGFH